MSRERLPDRRRGFTCEFQHDGFRFAVSAGYFRDGRLAEVFLSARKPGTPIEAVTRDAAILVSLCLQHGVAVETIMHALTRDDRGEPATAIGSALDMLAKGTAS